MFLFKGHLVRNQPESVSGPMITKQQNRTTIVKNPNWPEANDLAILQVQLGS